jgi:hypothetical protein
MADLDHYWGGDLSLSPTGDLATVSGAQRGEQRIIRRLCTNGRDAIGQRVGEYLFHSDYGAGIPRYVGQPGPEARVEGVCREQMFNEVAVVQSPPPDVSVTADQLGTLTLTIAYTDAPSKTPRTLSFDVSA